MKRTIILAITMSIVFTIGVQAQSLVGFYQERGKPARRLVPGDIVEIAPNVEHWHGAILQPIKIPG